MNDNNNNILAIVTHFLGKKWNEKKYIKKNNQKIRKNK